jgi:hypothetical protein
VPDNPRTNGWEPRQNVIDRALREELTAVSPEGFPEQDHGPEIRHRQLIQPLLERQARVAAAGQSGQGTLVVSRSCKGLERPFPVVVPSDGSEIQPFAFFVRSCNFLSASTSYDQ